METPCCLVIIIFNWDEDTLWTGFSMGNSTTVLPSVKRGNMVSPSGSSSEAQYLRGLAVVRSFNRVTSLFFISYGRRDASLEDADSLSEQTAISSILESGYHRTVSELKSRRTIREFVTGAHAYYRSNRWKLGCTIYHQQYNRDITLNTNDELLKTSIQRGMSLEGSTGVTPIKGWQYIGESSLQFKAGNSHLAGLSISPDPSCSFSAIFSITMDSTTIIRILQLLGKQWEQQWKRIVCRLHEQCPPEVKPHPFHWLLQVSLVKVSGWCTFWQT